MPTASKTNSRSNPGDVAFLNFERNSFLSPPCNIYLQTYCTSSTFNTIIYFSEKDAVAIVSSWFHLPWIMEVQFAILCLSTEFQTFETQGHTLKAKIGQLLHFTQRCTKSRQNYHIIFWNSTKVSYEILMRYILHIQFCQPEQKWMNTRSGVSKKYNYIAFTFGWWMNSLVIHILWFEKCFHVSKAIPTAFSTSQQRP